MRASYTREEWAQAYQAACKELGMPARGPKGSPENLERTRISILALARAHEILRQQKGQ